MGCAADDDDQAVRSVLGKLLFSGDDAAKPVRVLSGRRAGQDAVREV